MFDRAVVLYLANGLFQGCPAICGLMMAKECLILVKKKNSKNTVHRLIKLSIIHGYQAIKVDSVCFT